MTSPNAPSNPNIPTLGASVESGLILSVDFAFPELGELSPREQQIKEFYESQLATQQKIYHGVIGQQRQMLHTDTLTGIPNLLAWNEKITSLSHEEQDTPFAIGYGDVTNLKAINDLGSHEEGDAAIIGTAQAVKRHSDFLARLTRGDEFGMILNLTANRNPNLTVQERAKQARARVLGAVARVGIQTGYTQRYGFALALGVIVHDPQMPIAETVSLAEAKMYKHKDRLHEKHGAHRKVI